MSAYIVARRVCRVLHDDAKRQLCVRLLSRMLIYEDDDNAYMQVVDEFKKSFTDDERVLIKSELAKLLGAV